jgi:hypothetical protein
MTEKTMNHKRRNAAVPENTAKKLTLAQPAPAFATMAAALLYSSQAAWTAAIVCLSLSAGETFGRAAGFLVAGGLCALTSAVRQSRR